MLREQQTQLRVPSPDPRSLHQRHTEQSLSHLLHPCPPQNLRCLLSRCLRMAVWLCSSSLPAAAAVCSCRCLQSASSWNSLSPWSSRCLILKNSDWPSVESLSATGGKDIRQVTSWNKSPSGRKESIAIKRQAYICADIAGGSLIEHCHACPSVTFLSRTRLAATQRRLLSAPHRNR